MNKPYLLVVTGRPGAGKTTFAKALADQFQMPLLSRDQIKEGYVHTCRKGHDDLSKETNGIVNKVFFDTIHVLLKGKVSLIIEAAFQNRIWTEKLMPFLNQADIHLLICKVEDELAHKRYMERGINNPLREYFHGDMGVSNNRNGEKVNILPYEEPKIAVPTYCIDTKDSYKPTIEELRKMIIG